MAAGVCEAVGVVVAPVRLLTDREIESHQFSNSQTKYCISSYLMESLKGYSDILLFWKGPTLLKELRIVLEPEK